MGIPVKIEVRVNKSSAPILAGTLAGLLALSLACSGDGPTAVVAGPPASLLITGGQDQSIIVGKELPTILEVKIVDAQQRPVKGQVVNFRVISGGGSVFAGVAITSDSGIAKERWTLGTVAADSQRVEARAVDDKGTALVFGVFRAVALPDVPATVRKIAGDSQVVAAAATTSDSLSVAVVDRYGNPVPRSTVRWTVTSGGGRVSADSSVANDAGQAKVRWTVGQRVDSTQRVSAQHGTLTPVTFSATVKAADAAALQLAQQAVGAASGAAFVTAPKVRIRDAYGNQVTTSAAAVTLTVSSGASIVGTATANAVNGEATFSTAGLSGTVGDYTLTYSATGLTAATQTIALTAGAPSQLAITTQPTGAVSGAAFTTQPVVELRDAQGNRTTSTLTVTASVASGGGTLQGTAAVAAVNGVATFTNLRIDRATAHTLTFTGATPSLTATSSAFTIAPGAASQLAVTTPAAGARSGAVFTTQPILEVRDAAGNRVTGSTASITATVNGATVAGTATVSAVDGVATYTTLGLSDTVGTYTVTFAATGLTSATQSLSLTAGAATQLAIVTPAAGAASGVAFTTQPVVESRDAAGNRTASAANVVLTVSIGGTLAGATQADAASGRATYTNVSLSGLVGTYTLTYSATGLTAATQTIALTAGAPSQIAVVTQAAGAASGATFTTQPVVEIRDAAGNRTCSSVEVAITVSAGGTLSGETRAVGACGTFTYTNVGLSGLAGTYTLTYSQTGLTTATQTIALTAGAASQLAVTTLAAGATGSGPFVVQPVVQVRDAAGNLTNSASTSVTVSSSVGASTTGTATVVSAAGIATFSSVGLSGQRGLYTLSYSATGITAASQRYLLKSLTPTATGYNHTCALATSGKAFCWGGYTGQWNVGQLGRSVGGTTDTPDTVATNLSFTALAAGRFHTCGISDTGEAYCWGLNDFGQLGDGTTANRSLPTRVDGALTFTAIAAGINHSCGLTSGGQVYCWGRNASGEVGDGTRTQRLSPVAVSGGLTFSSIDAGDTSMCGLLVSGAAYCWGDNGTGQLGDGTTTNRTSPTSVSGGLNFSRVSITGTHACGITSAGAAYCWGSNSDGQLGNGASGGGSLVLERTPVAVGGGLTFTSILAGGGYSCGLIASGAAYCWGWNEYGVLGNGTTTGSTTPVAVSGGLTFSGLSNGDGNHLCGTTSAGALYCWGWNQYGGLGIGSTSYRSTVPVRVSGATVYGVP
jgi:alpha-tubulin suppressor-like RCC1 family protein